VGVKNKEILGKLSLKFAKPAKYPVLDNYQKKHPRPDQIYYIYIPLCGILL
jgi:hypothetical protein